MTPIKQSTRVLAGNRLEVMVPGLSEGELVEVTVQRCGEPRSSQCNSVLSFLDSLPAGPRAFASWDEYELHLRREHDEWDR